MPSVTPLITLYQLALFPASPFSPAPHVYKTTLPLRLLGVPYETKLVTLKELREDLPAILGLPKVTLPVESRPCSQSSPPGAGH